MDATVLIYVGPESDFEVPKLGPLYRGVPRIVTDLEVANNGGTTAADFAQMVQGFYNRGQTLIDVRDLDADEQASLKAERDAVSAATDLATEKATKAAKTDNSQPPDGETATE